MERERVETLSETYVAYPGDTVTLISYINNVNDIKHQVTLDSPTYGVTFGTDILINHEQMTTFIMPERDVVINTTFGTRTYAFVVNVTGNVSGEGLEFSPEYPVEGDTVTVSAPGLTDIRQVAISSADVTFSESVLTTATGTATFTMPEGDVTIDAIFSARYYPITLGASGDETGEAFVATVGGIVVTEAKGGDIVTITGTLGSNRQVSLTGTAPTGIMFSDEVINTDGGTYSFTMPESAVNISGQFTSIPHTITTSITSYAPRFPEEKIELDVTEARSGDLVTFTVWVDPSHEMELTTSDGTPLSVDIVRGEGDAQNWISTDVTFTMPADGIEIIGRIEARAHYVSGPGDFSGDYCNGTTTIDKRWARPGDTVSITATIINYKPSGSVSVGFHIFGTDTNNFYMFVTTPDLVSTESFTMPNRDVILTLLET